MAVLSTLRPADQPLSLGGLDDDCLLLLFGTLTVAQLFHLRGVSRRLCHLIERHSLPAYRTLIYGYDRTPGNEMQSDREHSGTVQVFFAKQTHTYSQVCRRTGLENIHYERILPNNKRASIQLVSFPLDLPHFFPRLSCLTFTYFLTDREQELTAEQLTVNRLAIAYLNSHWSTTLVSLHLYIEGPSVSQPDNAFFSQINQLSSLRHLYLECTRFFKPEDSFCLPDSMPIFDRLHSFSLHFYGGANTALLLQQLGPELSFLSLYEVTCSVDEYAAFLRAKPTYRRTLKEAEVCLNGYPDWRLFTVTAQCLFSLERFFLCAYMEPEDDLIPTFNSLSRLSHLRTIFFLPMTIGQLRALRRQYSRPGGALALPRLRHLSRAALAIYNSVRLEESFTEDELFDQLLPPVAEIFCGLETLELTVFKLPQTSDTPIDGPLGEQLSVKVGQLFTGLRECETQFFIQNQ